MTRGKNPAPHCCYLGDSALIYRKPTLPFTFGTAMGLANACP